METGISTGEGMIGWRACFQNRFASLRQHYFKPKRRPATSLQQCWRGLLKQSCHSYCWMGGFEAHLVLWVSTCDSQRLWDHSTHTFWPSWLRLWGDESYHGLGPQFLLSLLPKLSFARLQLPVPTRSWRHVPSAIAGVFPLPLPPRKPNPP